DGGDLNSAKAHKIDKQLYESASLRDAIAKTGEHPLLESRIWFFLGEGFFQHFVHDFVLLMSLSARGAIDDMRVKRAAFILGKLAVNVGGEPVIDFVVNGCHTFSPLRRERDEAVYASTRERGREFRAARHWSGPRYFRWCDNPSLRSNARSTRRDEAPAALRARNAIVDPTLERRSVRPSSVQLLRQLLQTAGRFDVSEKCR